MLTIKLTTEDREETYTTTSFIIAFKHNGTYMGITGGIEEDSETNLSIIAKAQEGIGGLLEIINKDIQRRLEESNEAIP